MIFCCMCREFAGILQNNLVQYLGLFTPDIEDHKFGSHIYPYTKTIRAISTPHKLGTLLGTQLRYIYSNDLTADW